MKDISFIIGLKIDSEDRLNNLKISVDNLRYNFPHAEIIIAELDEVSKIDMVLSGVNHIFVKTSDFFNRQKAVNYGVSASKRKVVVHYDADIILNKKTIERCYNLIVNDEIDVIYPHNGYFYDIPKQYHKKINEDKNLDSINVEQCKLLNTQNVGGAVFFNREIYWKGGGASEKFLGVGYEDNEIFERFTKLKYRIGKINTPIFHLTHERKETSFEHNPYDGQNRNEFLKIRKMSFEELSEEIKNWNYEKKNIY